MADSKQYRVLSTLDHDHVRHEQGALVELADDGATMNLINLGVIAAVEDAQPKPEKKPRPKPATRTTKRRG